MKIVRTSRVSAETNVMEIDVTREQIAQWEGGMLIQQAMPNLCEDEREFIMNGITPDEWDAHMVGGEDADEEGQPTWEQEWEDYGEVYSDEY